MPEPELRKVWVGAKSTCSGRKKFHFFFFIFRTNSNFHYSNNYYTETRNSVFVNFYYPKHINACALRIVWELLRSMKWLIRKNMIQVHK